MPWLVFHIVASSSYAYALDNLQVFSIEQTKLFYLPVLAWELLSWIKGGVGSNVSKDFFKRLEGIVRG